MEKIREVLFSDLSYYKTAVAELAYTDTQLGDEVLVFLHGLGGDMQAWTKNLSYFITHYRCIAIDLPDFGDSLAISDTYSISTMSDLVIGLLADLGISRYSLVGHSMGAQVCISIAAAVPDRIAKTILVTPAGIETYLEREVMVVREMFTREMVQSYPDSMIRKNLDLNFYSRPADTAFILDDKLAMKKDGERYTRYCNAVASCALAIITHPTREELASLTRPCLIFFGLQDRLIPHHMIHPDQTIAQIAGQAQKLLPTATIELYNECGHFLHWEKAAAFNERTMRFLTS